ncbi:MAG: hypothetical protein WCX61_00445 [Candidatus Peribacteraceae bacterium]
MQKDCANCGSKFEITDDDLQYYEKISPIISERTYQILPPTYCPQCRQQRRYAIRNERNLYKRKCDFCKKDILSMYSADKPFPVYCPECWWSDKWHATHSARDFDFSKSFFEQFVELQKEVPRISLYLVNSENCNYCNFVGDCKRCYLSFGSVYSEDCLYGSAYYSKDCVDNLVTRECELCYECTDSRKLYQCLFCQDCYNSSDLLYCYDMQGCSECIACASLRNKKYHIGNKPLSQEQYEAIRKEIDLCNLVHRQKWQKELNLVKQAVIHHYMPSSNVQNVSGTHIYNSKNTFQSFFVDRCEDCAYCMQVVDLKDCHDNNYTEENECCNEYLGMYGAKNTHFSTFSRHTYEVYFSEYCINSKNCFGCAGIRDRNYCIFNKEYSKEEYEKLIPKIIEHMKSTGEFGEFFPVSLSPFAYNESVAQEYFPLSKEEVFKRGWKWRDQKDEMPKVEKIIPAEKLPDSIDDIPDDILNWAIECEATRRPFRIIKQELDFYRQMKLPIPHYHPDERHKRRMMLRNPRKLWDRTCAKCKKEIQTTYSPERPEMVYCEECYLKEVY